MSAIHPPGQRRRASRATVATALVAAVLAVGCGGPRAVSLAELAFEMERHDGDEVVTQGVVMAFDGQDGAPERHVVIQDAQMNRVELIPRERAEPYLGSTVEVAGDFEFDPDRGRRLHIDRIDELGPGD